MSAAPSNTGARLRTTDLVVRLPEAVEIVREGLRGADLTRRLRGRFPELDEARARALGERAEADADEDRGCVPWPNGRPADGTRPGEAWMKVLQLVERGRLRLVTGCLVGVATTHCPLCGALLRITDCDPGVHLLCHGGCEAPRVVARLRGVTA